MNNGSRIDILQALYDSEINASLGWLWDGGIDWKLYLPGAQILEGNAGTVQEAVQQLIQAATKHFPNSAFAKRLQTSIPL